MKSYPSRILFSLLILLWAGAALAGLDKDVMNAVKDEFNLQPRSVRADYLKYPNYTLLLDGTVYQCDVPIALRRLGAAGETFRLRKVATKDDRVHVELETLGKRRIRVVVYDRDKLRQGFLDTAVPKLLEEIFEFGESVGSLKFIGNAESRMYHMERCNHLPLDDRRVVLESEAEAEAQGFRPCPICFDDTPALPYAGYLGYRIKALQGLREIELLFPPSRNADMQAKLEASGSKILENWPFPLAGFEYRFQLLETEWVLAGTMGTGLVVISEGFMNVMESEEELLFVLAHEVAHCEIHLPPTSPARALLNAMNVHGGDMDLYKAYDSWNGSFQTTADLIALSWFRGPGGEGYDVRRARASLAKIQQIVGATEQLGNEPGQDRGIHHRVGMFDPEHYRSLPARKVFIGYDGEDDPRYEVRVLGVERTSGKPKLYMLLTVTDYHDEVIASRERYQAGLIKDWNGHTSTLDVGFVFGAPGHSTLLTADCERRDDFHGIEFNGLVSLRLDYLSGVKRWSEAE